MLQTHFYIHLNIAEKYFYSTLKAHALAHKQFPKHTHLTLGFKQNPWRDNQTTNTNCAATYTRKKTDFPDFVGNAARNETILGTQSLGTHRLGLLSAPPFQNKCKPQTGTNTHTQALQTQTNSQKSHCTLTATTELTQHTHTEGKIIKLLQVINFYTATKIPIPHLSKLRFNLGQWDTPST